MKTRMRSEAGLWHDMIVRSWEPRQWFFRDGEDECEDNLKPEGRIMYVVRPVSNPPGVGGTKWVVGFFAPSGEWHAESSHPTAETAARRVRWLNGGDMDQQL